MTPDATFLQAIIENPDDDTPRLVYADWLEEHGQPERAEFIRVQCRLARMASHDERRPPLEGLERRLLELYQDEWLGPLQPLLTGWTYRRGFLDTVCLPAATYLRHKTFPWPAILRRVEVDLGGFEVPVDALDLVPESVAREHALLPLDFQDRTLVLAMRDPEDRSTLEKLELILNQDIKPVPAPASQIIEAINRHYGDPDAVEVDTSLDGCFMSPSPFPSAGTALDFSDEDDGRAGRLLTRLIEKAVRRKVKTVRIEAEPDCFCIHYFDAAVAVQGEVYPLRLFKPLVARLRIAAGIWLLDQRPEQAGVFRRTVGGGRQVEVKVVIVQEDGCPAMVVMSLPG